MPYIPFIFHILGWSEKLVLLFNLLRMTQGLQGADVQSVHFCEALKLRVACGEHSAHFCPCNSVQTKAVSVTHLPSNCIPG